jgi:hypothetical protein
LPDPEHFGAVAGHAVVQPPHVLGWLICVSHPSFGLAEQCAHPAAHDAAGTEHTPPPQATGPVTFFKALQSCPHAPQFFESVCVLVHVPLHDVLADGGHEHPPPPIVHT